MVVSNSRNCGNTSLNCGTMIPIGGLHLSTEATVPYCNLIGIIRQQNRMASLEYLLFPMTSSNLATILDVPSVCQKPLQTTHRQTTQSFGHTTDPSEHESTLSDIPAKKDTCTISPLSAMITPSIVVGVESSTRPSRHELHAD
jgi:hypothetical protein